MDSLPQGRPGTFPIRVTHVAHLDQSQWQIGSCLDGRAGNALACHVFGKEDFKQGSAIGSGGSRFQPDASMVLGNDL